MIKYRVNKYGYSIDRISVIRETEKMVFVQGWRGQGERRESKDTAFDKWFDSFDEAKDFILSRIKIDLSAAGNSIKRLSAKMAEVESMTEQGDEE